MANKLFVGSLSWNVGEHELRHAFGQYGPLSNVKVITDRETGRSRGFGFVTFQSSADAATAMGALNDTPLDGRPIRVNFSNE